MQKCWKPRRPGNNQLNPCYRMQISHMKLKSFSVKFNYCIASVCSLIALSVYRSFSRLLFHQPSTPTFPHLTFWVPFALQSTCITSSSPLIIPPPPPAWSPGHSLASSPMPKRRINKVWWPSQKIPKMLPTRTHTTRTSHKIRKCALHIVHRFWNGPQQEIQLNLCFSSFTEPSLS